MRSFDEYKDFINSHLTDLIDVAGPEASVLGEAMRYSLEVGGKRLRPVLLLAGCEFAGGDINEALPYALSLEYIHTYSLIHDDLPAMDNDDLRRGKPTNHKVYGEAMAILAGDGLLSTAAETVSEEPLRYHEDPKKMYSHLKAAHEIISRAGAHGMIAGQTADILGERMVPTPELIRFIELHKTADLITAPVRAGLMIAGAEDETLDRFTSYAIDIGVAFQILDDILDIEGDPALLGKTLGKDAEQGKCNYAYVHGMPAAKEELHRLTSEAKKALSVYGDDAAFFTALADSLETRNN
ncbi:MAG: polyprenyl synthetase family protein [Mogibacterium sp.]|nr:polyprenyl synthetase family protein [Mogibacterium sp.]